MHRGILSAIIIMALAAIASAQARYENKYELFGGFSIASFDTGLASNPNLVGADNRETALGFETSVTGYVKHNLGLEGDFDIHFNSKTFTFVSPATSVDVRMKGFNFMGGPHYRFTSHNSTSRLTPYVRALAGGKRTSFSNASFTGVGGGLVPGAGASETDFAMKFGGGLDYELKHHYALRFGADYNPIFEKADGVLNPTTHNRTRDDFVFSAGVVFR